MGSFLPKTLFIFVAAQMGMFEKYGILVFGIGHLIYTLLLMVVSFVATPREYKSLWWVKIKSYNNENENDNDNDKVKIV
jgi:hypothetical protein